MHKQTRDKQTDEKQINRRTGKIRNAAYESPPARSATSTAEKMHAYYAGFPPNVTHATQRPCVLFHATDATMIGRITDLAPPSVCLFVRLTSTDSQQNTEKQRLV